MAQSCVWSISWDHMTTRDFTATMHSNSMVGMREFYVFCDSSLLQLLTVVSRYFYLGVSYSGSNVINCLGSLLLKSHFTQCVNHHIFEDFRA